MTDKIRQKPEEKSGMEVIVKRLKRMISAVLVCGLVLGMSGCGGCGKKEVYQGGEGTNFPYTCQKEGKGTYLIKLDGSYGEKDYRWTAENLDEAVVKVEVAKKEKKGKVSYRVTPLSDGMAEIRLAYLVNVYAVVSDLAVSYVVEPVQKICYRCLSRTRRTDERHLLSGLGIKRDIVKDLLVFFI